MKFELLHTIHVVTDYVVYLAVGFFAGRDFKRWRKRRITRAEEDLWAEACWNPMTQTDALGLGLEKWVQLHRYRARKS